MNFEVKFVLNNGDSFDVGGFDELDQAVAICKENEGKYKKAEIVYHKIGKEIVLIFKEVK